MSRARPEDAIQRAVANALDCTGVLWNHCPNGGGRKRIEAAILNGLGVKPGVPDIQIYEPPRTLSFEESLAFRGAALEIKAPGNTATEEQLRWLRRLNREGWWTAVGTGVDECLAILRRWGYIL